MKIKALSLWQPWATLIAFGAKQFETRSWYPLYRGPLVIHAAKTTTDLNVWFADVTFRRTLTRAGYQAPADLPLGAALCICDLVEAHPTDKIWRSLSADELAFGNYAPGRFALELRNVRRFAKPIPLRGAQSFFWAEIPDADMKAARPIQAVRL